MRGRDWPHRSHWSYWHGSRFTHHPIHLGQLLVVLPSLCHFLLGQAEKVLCRSRVALLKYAIPALSVDIIFERNIRLLGVQLERVLALRREARIVPVERPA